MIDQPKNPANSANQTIGLIAIMVMVVLFGASPTTARLAFDGGSGPITLQVLRFGFAIVGIGAYLAFAGPAGRYIDMSRIKWLLTLSVLTGVSSICYMSAVKYIPVGLSSLVFFSFPILVAVSSHFLGLELLTRRRCLALAIAFSGLVFVLGGDYGTDYTAEYLFGIGLAFSAGLCVATNMLIFHRLSGYVAPTVIAFVSCTVSLVMFTSGVLLIEGWRPPETDLGWGGAIGNGLTYSVGLVCLYTGLRHLGPVKVSTISNLEPLISVGFAFVLLGEVLAPAQLAGALLVFAGISLIRKA